MSHAIGSGTDSVGSGAFTLPRVNELNRIVQFIYAACIPAGKSGVSADARHRSAWSMVIDALASALVTPWSGPSARALWLSNLNLFAL